MQMSERDKLIVENQQLVYFTLHKYFPSWAYDEDIQQIGMVALCEAADKYDPEKGAFSTFAAKYIWNRVAKEFRRLSTQSRTGTEVSVGLEVSEDCTLEDCLVGDTDVDYCDRDTLFNVLKPREREVAELLEQGYSQAEIAKRLGFTRSNVSLLARNIKRKWRTLL
jgi:RNA polymerase sporulation-specific sigma factor